MFSAIAWAQETAAQTHTPSTFETIFPWLLIPVIFYFFIIRPQQRRAQTQKDFLGSLKRGDSVLTSGGIMGTIEGLTERFITLQIANGVKIKVLRSAVISGVSEELEKNT